MNEINIINKSGEIDEVSGMNGLVKLTEDLLMDARASINNNKALSIPIAELSTLGAGVSSLVPAFNTITQTTTLQPTGFIELQMQPLEMHQKLQRMEMLGEQ